MSTVVSSGYGRVVDRGCRYDCTVFVMVVILETFEGLYKGVDSARGFHGAVCRILTEEVSGDVR